MTEETKELLKNLIIKIKDSEVSSKSFILDLYLNKIYEICAKDAVEEYQKSIIEY